MSLYHNDLVGIVDPYALFVYYSSASIYAGIRPVLKVKDMETAKTGDQIWFEGYTWTVIAKGYILCDKTIGYIQFRKDEHALDANEYKKSDVREYIETWCKECDIMYEKQKSGKDITEKTVAEKIIKNMVEIPLMVEEITLLSKEEYTELFSRIPYRKDWWWLRSPHISGEKKVDCVYNDGRVHKYKVTEDAGVRPVLKVRLFDTTGLEIGDRIVVAGHTWKVISEKYILCDDIIDHILYRYTLFRESDWLIPEERWRNQDICNYEKSDLKKWLEDWWRDKMRGKSILFG